MNPFVVAANSTQLFLDKGIDIRENEDLDKLCGYTLITSNHDGEFLVGVKCPSGHIILFQADPIIGFLLELVNKEKLAESEGLFEAKEIKFIKKPSYNINETVYTRPLDYEKYIGVESFPIKCTIIGLKANTGEKLEFILRLDSSPDSIIKRDYDQIRVIEGEN